MRGDGNHAQRRKNAEIIDVKINKTSSQAFLDIRNKIQSAMKEQNIKYEDVKESIAESMKEVNSIQEQAQEKRSWRDMISDLHSELDGEKTLRLNVVNGKVIIDSNDSLQRKWFEEFKK